MAAYHDDEWGVPVHDDRHLFEMLILEGAQAGLSWATVLTTRANYKRAFDNFDVEKVARYRPAKLAKLMEDPGIIRNRLKIASAVSNAQAYLRVQEEFGSFDAYLWSFVDGVSIENNIQPGEALPARTELSDRTSADLKRRGFKFVGSIIIYSYLQAVGVVNDHTSMCPAPRVARESSTTAARSTPNGSC